MNGEDDNTPPGGEGPERQKPLELGMRKDGRSKVALPPETIDALRADRTTGMSYDAIADKYDLAINTVRKYTGNIVTIPQREQAERRISTAAEKGVTERHIQTVTQDAKRRDEQATTLGDGILQTVDTYVKGEIAKKMAGGGSNSFNEVKEMMMMRFMVKAMGDEGQGQSSIVQEMRIENDKLRSFYEDKVKEQDAKLRELVFEKKIETLGDRQAETESILLNRLDDIEAKVEQYKTIPPSATPEQKKDAITQLEDAGNQLERMKVTLGKFGLIPATPGAQTGAPEGKEVWRNPDGSVDKSLWIVDQLKSTVDRGLEAWQKKTPEPGNFVETPAPAALPEQKKYVMEMDPQEYYELLHLKTQLNENETAFMRRWEQIHPPALPQTKVKEYKPPERREAAAPAVQPAEQPAEAVEPVGCMVCGRPEIYQNDLCEQCWNDQNRAPEQPEPGTKKGIIEKLKEQEEDELKRTQGLV